MRALGRTLVSLGVVGSATAGVVLLLPGATPPAAAAGLIPYASCDALLSHYRAELRKSATPWGFGQQGYGRLEFATGAVPVPAAAPVTRDAGGALSGGTTGGGTTGATGGGLDAVGSGKSGTNLQEQGVDEPDTTKLADGLIVTFAQGRLRVLRSGAEPELLSTTAVTDTDQGYGGELLLSGDRAVVLISSWRNNPGSADSRYGYYGGGDPLTTAVLVDLATPEKPVVLERLQLEGTYLSARLADGRVRLVTSSTPRLEATYPTGQQTPADQKKSLRANQRTAEEISLLEVLPRAVHTGRDGRVRSDSRAVGCDEVSRAEDPRGASTLLVTTLDPSRDLVALDSEAVTTDGQLVYASQGRLYIATSRWGTQQPTNPEIGSSAPRPDAEQVTTELHAFNTTTDDTRYVGTGSVPGYIMGRWALSEHEGRLRVAVTSSPPWQGAEQSISSLHVLAESAGELVTVGKVSGMGKGERIQAVRYFGTMATVVTFRQTDPLYVLDLADAEDPRIVGELKIPGFSTYLHPIGDGLLLGVGMDADEKTGRTTGMQLSTFDLRNRAEPKQIDRLSLGQGWSPALDDSRAFGYDPARRHALLPFSNYRGGGFALGVRVGADGQLSEAGRLDLASGFQAERVLHDAEHVYAVNQTGIATGDAGDLQRTGSLSWK